MGQVRGGGQDLGVGRCHTLGLQCHVPLGHGGEGVLAVKVTVKDGLGVEGMGEVLNLAREVFALEETEIDVEIEETT